MGIFLSVLTVFSGGIIAGSSLAAFYLALNIFLVLSPEIKCAYKFYAAAAWLGAILSSVISFSDISLKIPMFAAAVPGFACGVFAGILIACIAEMLNVMRLLDEAEIGKLGIAIIIVSVMVGKLSGSLVYWTGHLFK